MMSDEPTGAYDTGGSGFDATRNADNPVGVEGAGGPEAAPTVNVSPTAEPASTAIPQASWDRAVGDWINAHVRSSPITQGASGAWEHLNSVLPKLKEFLEREIKT